MAARKSKPDRVLAKAVAAGYQTPKPPGAPNTTADVLEAIRLAERAVRALQRAETTAEQRDEAALLARAASRLCWYLSVGRAP